MGTVALLSQQAEVKGEVSDNAITLITRGRSLLTNGNNKKNQLYSLTYSCHSFLFKNKLDSKFNPVCGFKTEVSFLYNLSSPLVKLSCAQLMLMLTCFLCVMKSLATVNTDYLIQIQTTYCQVTRLQKASVMVQSTLTHKTWYILYNKKQQQQ